ncbi:glutamine amidotransferase [Hydrogenophaga laconesensis]|uniref:GMP synthase (Glutamine-hydrolyzing) n=1 Tax=Hydrogenophaga laconesensis TaxID=1805971 RepID=A0ABU1V750_9BURK|nr:glutamine amidotransferase [Hydrogenophaga laconesensis]MDR7093215.1 GMP synthase (glutamine-hydrolyzing) [Hydrogenophaga laconesensis]
MSQSNSAQAFRAGKPILIVAAGKTFPDLCQQEGDFSDWIERGLGEGVAVRHVDAHETGTYPEPHELAGVVVSGSHDMVSDRQPWSERLGQWMKRCVDADVPVLGICYGHQLLAHAMGGQVGNLPNGPEVGTQDIRLNHAAQEDELLGHLPKSFPAQLVHYQSALSLPPGAVLLASSTAEPHQAFRVGRRGWGVQFHPEFSPTAMRGYIGRMTGSLGDVSRLLSDVRPSPAAAGILRRFSEVATG